MNFFPPDHRPGSQHSKLHVARATASRCFQFANSTPAFHNAAIWRDCWCLVFYSMVCHFSNTPDSHITLKRGRWESTRITSNFLAQIELLFVAHHFVLAHNSVWMNSCSDGQFVMWTSTKYQIDRTTGRNLGGRVGGFDEGFWLKKTKSE